MKLKKNRLYGLLFASPAIVYFAVFFVFPFCYASFLGFQEYNLLSPPEFIGIDNYTKMFSDPMFWNSIKVTVIYVIGSCVPVCIFALLFAILFNRKFKGRQVYLTIFLMACLMGLIPSCMAWKTLLHRDFGLFNKIFFESWGFKGSLDWLQDPNLSLLAMIIVSLSTGIPYYSIYLIGAVASVPDSYYEVGQIEGANFFQRLRYITLPSIKPVFLFVVIVSIISAFQYIGPFYVITGGGPIDSTRVISLYTFNNAFEFQNFGYASAMTVVILLILIPVTLLALKLGSREK